MTLAAAFALMTLIIAGCVIYAVLVLGRGHQDGPGRSGCLRRAAGRRAARAVLLAAIAILSVRAVRLAVLRARWAWRCRACPPRNDGPPLGELERGELTAIVRGWGKTARPERSRT